MGALNKKMHAAGVFNVTFGNIPISLKKSVDFESLFELRPRGRSSVLVYDKKTKRHNEKQIFRSYMAFLKTPEFSSEVEKSYMFSSKSEVLPVELKPFLDFAQSLDARYNQMVVNWYEPEDFMEYHRDCVAGMVSPEAPILCISLDADAAECRFLKLKTLDNAFEQEIQLQPNSYYVLNDNLNYRHAVGTGKGRRISITFRMMKD